MDLSGKVCSVLRLFLSLVASYFCCNACVSACVTGHQKQTHTVGPFLVLALFPASHRHPCPSVEFSTDAGKVWRTFRQNRGTGQDREARSALIADLHMSLCRDLVQSSVSGFPAEISALPLSHSAKEWQWTDTS